MSGDGHPIPDAWMSGSGILKHLATEDLHMDIETRLKAAFEYELKPIHADLAWLKSRANTAECIASEYAKRLAALEAKAQPTPAQPSRVGRFYRWAHSGVGVGTVYECVEDGAGDDRGGFVPQTQVFYTAQSKMRFYWAHMTEVRRVETWEPVV